MNNDLTCAKEVLLREDLSCVLCKDGELLKSGGRGISPLIAWIGQGTDLWGFCAADKIVGKAAALLFARMGVRAVYAPVMSETAVQVLEKFGIEASYDALVPAIINREKTGQCPMELTVGGIGDPDEAYAALTKKLEELQKGKIKP